MAGLQMLTVLAAISGVSDTVLLDFSATWCGPCQQMKPIVHRLVEEGYPVRVVDVDREPQLAAQYRVTSLPCFVMIVDGREVDRVVGVTSSGRLRQMLALGAREPSAETQLVEVDTNPRNSPSALPSATSLGPEAAQRRALVATVRIKVEDSAGNSFGTGTVVDSHGEEALVLTCGHIFRDSQGKGRITVDLFLPEGQRTVSGLLIAYDLTRDIGLIAIRPEVKLDPVPIAVSDVALQPGRYVFSVGCDRGGTPRVVESRITTVDRYMGPSNIEVAGQPIVGRSGGGLFSTNGELIGVCNAADPTDNEGLYAALSTIQAELDDNKLSFVYRGDQQQQPIEQPPVASLIASDMGRPTGSFAQGIPFAPAMPNEMPSASFAIDAGAAIPRVTPTRFVELMGRADDLEVICIVQSRSNIHGRSEVIRLQQPSLAFVEQLAREYRSQLGQIPTDMRIERATASTKLIWRPWTLLW